MIADAIEKHHSISAEWLMTGKGEMMAGGRYPSPGAGGVAETPAQHGVDSVPPENTDSYARISFVDLKASAGDGTVVEYEPIENTSLRFGRQWLHERIGISHKELIMLAVEGDSMAPTFSPNDLIMVDTSASKQQFKDGIWVFSINNAVHVKRVQQMGSGQFKAISDNKEYQAFMLEEPCNFIGRVVWSDKRW